jgi:hypothetical protein
MDGTSWTRGRTMAQVEGPPGNSFRMGCGLGFVAGAIISGVLVGLFLSMGMAPNTEWRPRHSIEKQPQPETLQASIELRDAEMVVINQGLDDWRDVSIRLNHHRRSGESFATEYYSFKFRWLAAREQRTIPLKEFARADGMRFNADESKVVLLEISCETPNGPGQWSTDIFN